MSGQVKHFSLHRIDSTELRVIADAEAGVLPVIGVEEEVIRQYIERGAWIHQYVTLFILQDMGSLTRQLQSVTELPPGGREALEQRPVVNVYDLADLSGCQIFVNWQAMNREGYWEEPSIVRALLAHEHAHPFAECAATAGSRRLRIEIVDDNLPEALEGIPGAEDRAGEIRRILGSMGHKLCADAPREVLTNEFAIRSGFADAMMYLDSRNVANAATALAGREQLRAGLQDESDRGRMTRAAAAAILIVGDLHGYLDQAIETASFYRAGEDTRARELENRLRTQVFAHLRPGVADAFTALRDRYVELERDVSPAELVTWAEGVAGVLADGLATEGLSVAFRVYTA